MDSTGVAYRDVPDDYGIYFPLVSMDTEFKRPVEVSDVVTITAEPDLGTKSLGMEFTAIDEDGNARFSAREQHVCVSKADNESLPIPDGVRQALSEVIE